MTQQQRIFLSFMALGVTGFASAMSPLNIFRPQDYNTRPLRKRLDARFDVSVLGEFETETEGRRCSNCKTSPFQIWQAEQNAVAMLCGFDIIDPDPLQSQIDALKQGLPMGTGNDGVTGRIAVTGCVEVDWNVVISAQYHLTDDVTFIFALPVLSACATEARFEDKTPDAQKGILEPVTGDLANTLKLLGNGLDSGPWSETGIGDFLVMAEWGRHFPQAKPMLKDVLLNGRLGFSFPTGHKKNPDQLFPLAFGNDGSYGLIFGGRIELMVTDYARFGIDAEFLQLFGTERIRRIKTDETQTDLFLLQKECAYKDPGITERFSIFAELFQILRGFSARMTYQYFRHNDDTLILTSSKFSSRIANTAESLREWTTHHMLFDLEYDFAYDMPDSTIKPYAAWFYKVPFNGQRSITTHSTGFVFGVSY